MLPSACDFPELGGLALGVAEGEAETAAIGRPAQPKSETGSGDELMRIAAIDADDGELVAVGDEQAVAVGHPCGVVGEDVGDAADIAAESGHNPQGLLGIGLEMAVNDEPGAVGRERTDERRADFRRQLEVADFAIGYERDGEDGVAVLQVREVDARTVAGRAGKAFDIEVVGQDMAGVR